MEFHKSDKIAITFGEKANKHFRAKEYIDALVNYNK